MRDIMKEKYSGQRTVFRSQTERAPFRSRRGTVSSVTFYRHFRRVSLVHTKEITGGL